MPACVTEKTVTSEVPQPHTVALNSYQMHESFGMHTSDPGHLLVRADTPSWVRAELERMGYRIETWQKTSGPINAIYFDRAHGTLWGGSSDFGEDYGIAW